MKQQSFNQYSCQQKLPHFGKKAQQKLHKASVLIIGMGGLGCPAAQYLVAAGVGSVTMIDDDTISLSNLPRQILFSINDEGRNKAEVAAEKLKAQNPNVNVSALALRLNEGNALDVIKSYDIVLDCTDNFDSRYLINDACVLLSKPLVYGGALQYEGQVAIWNVPIDKQSNSVNYRDIFPQFDSAAIDCESGGVLPMLTGIIGCLQAGEALKYLAGLPGLLVGQIYVFDALTMRSRIIKLPKVSSTNITKLSQSRHLNVPSISVTDFNKIPATEKYQLIDVRTSNEHDQFNLGGKNIPLDLLSKYIDTLDFNKPTIYYCRSGVRSASAVNVTLTKYPKAKVMTLIGGIEAWQAVAK